MGGPHRASFAAISALAFLAVRPAAVAQHASWPIAWEAQPVRAPVPRNELRGTAPRVPPSVPEVSGPVEVDPQGGAAFWLSPLEMVEVRGEPGALRFVRVPSERGEQASFLLVEEQGVPVRPGVWYLTEPAGRGSVWLVTGTKRAKITVRRPRRPSSTVEVEAVRSSLLAWVDGSGPMPALPFDAGLRSRIEIDAEVARILAEGSRPDEPLHEAIRDWRKASALREWSLGLGGRSPFVRERAIALPGAPVEWDGLGTPYRFPPSSTREWQGILDGPAVLSVEVRGLLGTTAGDGTGATATVRVERDGHVVGDAQAPARAARSEGHGLWSDGGAPLALRSGEWVGAAEEIRIALLPGRHTYRIRWDGRALVRARILERRPRLGDALAGLTEWDDWAERAWRAARGVTGPRAELLRAFILDLAPHLGERPQPDGIESSSPQLRAAAALAASNPADAFTVSLLSSGALDSRPSLSWELRLRATGALIAAGNTAGARALLRASSAFPHSGWHASQLAELLERLPQGDPLRSRAAAAHELAWRKEPLADDIRRRYLASWADETRWHALRPWTDDDLPPPISSRWLDVDPEQGPSYTGSEALWPLDPGQLARFHIEAPDGSARVLRAYVVVPPRVDGVVAFRVGEERFPLLPIADVEPVEVALPAGDHTVRLEAPPGARAWLSQAPPGAAHPSSALLRVHWPVREGKRAVRFRVPDARLSSPIRVQLRSAGRPAQPIPVWLRTDVGPAIRFVLQTGGSSENHRSVDTAPGPASAAASAVIHLPAFTSEIWFESDDPDALLFASVSIRRDGSPPPATVSRATQPMDAAERLQRLVALSRQLSSESESGALWLTRAELLLDAAEEGLAREDLVRALARQESLNASDVDRLAGLLERLDGEGQGIIRFRTGLERPQLLSPAYAAIAERDEAVLSVDAQRARSLPREALLDDVRTPARRYARARALGQRGEEESAVLELVRLFHEVKRPELGLEALAMLERIQSSRDAWAEWGAPISVALSTEVDGWADVPIARRMRRQAQRWTTWLRAREAESDVGTINLGLQKIGGTPGEEIRKALLAPPWPLPEARLLPPGRSAVLDLTTSRDRFDAQVMCGSLRGSKVTGQPCRFVLRIDGRETADVRAACGQTALLTGGLGAPGRHQIEILLEETDAPVVGLARLESSGLDPDQPLPVLRARPSEAVSLTALGPGVLRIDARALAPALGREVRVSSISPTGGSASRVLSLSPEVDLAVRGAPAAVGHPSEVLWLLPESGPHSVSLEAIGGEALVRVGLGATRRPSQPLEEWWARAPTAVDPVAWPSLPAPLPLLPDGSVESPQSTRTLGTLSSEIALRGDDLEDGDGGDPLRVGVDARLTYRHRLAPGRVWIRLEPSARLPFGSSPVLGARFAGHLRKLPLDLRLTASGAAFTQTLSGSTRVSARANASLTRWIGLGPDVGLSPGASFTWESVASGGPSAGFDRLVYSRYRAEHPLQWRPGLTLRWEPFADQVGELSGWASSNADLATVDHASSRVRWAWLLSTAPATRLELRYELSWRPEDADRATEYWRHVTGARADLSVWRGREGRLLLFVEDAGWYSRPFGLQNVFSAGVRWDWAGGRGLRDVLPYEEEFDRVLDGDPDGR